MYWKWGSLIFWVNASSSSLSVLCRNIVIAPHRKSVVIDSNWKSCGNPPWKPQVEKTRTPSCNEEGWLLNSLIFCWKRNMMYPPCPSLGFLNFQPSSSLIWRIKKKPKCPINLLNCTRQKTKLTVLQPTHFIVSK
jgi:hypothetical protein